MKKGENKSAGIKGALKAYKVVYKTDKLVVLLLFPIAVIRALQPYIALFAPPIFCKVSSTDTHIKPCCISRWRCRTWLSV